MLLYFSRFKLVSMNLIIDVGNSFVKIAVFQEDELVEKSVVGNDETEKKILHLFSRYPKIKHAILSSVSNISFIWPKLLLEKVRIVTLDSSLDLPFKNRYATPETLGNDRKALIAAAMKNYSSKNVLVIDAGTCITYDFKNGMDEYLGGGISPGVRMRYKALNTFTSRLPLLETSNAVNLVGNSTVDSIHSGVIFGIIKEIEGIIGEYEARFKDLSIIITGGDAHFLSMRLKNVIFANSNFLLEGLNNILEFNINQ